MRVPSKYITLIIYPGFLLCYTSLCYIVTKIICRYFFLSHLSISSQSTKKRGWVPKYRCRRIVCRYIYVATSFYFEPMVAESKFCNTPQLTIDKVIQQKTRNFNHISSIKKLKMRQICFCQLFYLFFGIKKL